VTEYKYGFTSFLQSTGAWSWPASKVVPSTSTVPNSARAGSSGLGRNSVVPNYLSSPDLLQGHFCRSPSDMSYSQPLEGTRTLLKPHKSILYMDTNRVLPKACQFEPGPKTLVATQLQPTRTILVYKSLKV